MKNEGIFWVVCDAAGTPVGAAHATVDGETARLNICAVADIHDRSAVRYLISSQVLLDLTAAGVRAVILDTAMFLEPGLAYFQARLGFTIALIQVCVESAGRCESDDAVEGSKRRVPRRAPMGAAAMVSRLRVASDVCEVGFASRAANV